MDDQGNPESALPAGRAGIASAIEALRIRTRSQAEVITRLEHYQRVSLGVGLSNESATGFWNAYSAELRYLQTRLLSLKALIESFESYLSLGGALAGAGASEDDSIPAG